VNTSVRSHDRHRIPGIAAATLCIIVAACTSTPVIEPTDGARDVTIYVVRHDWHTGIVLRKADIPPGVWPEIADFPQAIYVEVGWGDREYYPAHDPGSGTASHAALIGGPGVLHVVGLREDPHRTFPRSEIVALPVSRRGLRRLCRRIAASYQRDAAGRPITLGQGLYGESRFYHSVERFGLFNTCNVWTAGMLREAGLPIAGALTAGSIMEQSRAVADALAPDGQEKNVMPR